MTLIDVLFAQHIYQFVYLARLLPHPFVALSETIIACLPEIGPRVPRILRLTLGEHVAQLRLG